MIQFRHWRHRLTMPGGGVHPDFDAVADLNVIGGDCVTTGIGDWHQWPPQRRGTDGSRFWHRPGGWLAQCAERRNKAQERALIERALEREAELEALAQPDPIERDYLFHTMEEDQ